MRRFFRWTAILVGVGVVALAVLWFAMPARERPEDGEADPILWLRRPIVKTLYRTGLVSHNAFGYDEWIPSEPSSESWSGTEASETATEWSRVAYGVEPVYRGLVWRAGFRVTVKVDQRTALPATLSHLRLLYDPGSGPVGIADGGPGERMPDGRTTRYAVRGYVPAEARRFGFVEVDAAGKESEFDGWGTK